jgi:hypothetical protein
MGKGPYNEYVGDERDEEPARITENCQQAIG